MHKLVSLLFMVTGVALSNGYGVQRGIVPKQPREPNKVAVAPRLWSMVQADLNRLTYLDEHRATNEFASSAYTPICCNDKLKNMSDQGAVCYAVLKFLRAAEMTDLPGECIVEAVVIQNQITPILFHLDDIGKTRLLWAFLVDERKLDDTKESQAMYCNDPVVWYRAFRDKIVAMLQENQQLIKTFQGRFYYDSMLGQRILRLETESLALQKAYARVVLDFLTWLEVLVTIKDEKTAAKNG